MPRHSEIPELGSTPQFVPVAEAPPLEPPPEAPELPPSALALASPALPIWRQDESETNSTIAIKQRIQRDIRHQLGAGPTFSSSIAHLRRITAPRRKQPTDLCTTAATRSRTVHPACAMPGRKSRTQRSE